MKIHLLSPDAKDWIDPPVHSLLRQLPDANKAQSVASADVTIVPISHHNEFRYNEGAMSSLRGKRWVLQDWSEFGWDWLQLTSYLWGQNRTSLPKFDNEEYRKFDQFMRDNPPILTFQRELLQKDRTDRLIPIEYAAWLPEVGASPKEEFLKRPLDCSYYWGRSHEARLEMHANIFSWARTGGYDLLSEWNHVDKAIADNPHSRKWLAVYAPHFSRIDVREVQSFLQKSKVTIVMNGAGVKTFRHGEACQDAILAVPKDELAWSYPWVWGQNCLKADVKTILDALMTPDSLYELYMNGMANASNYRYDAYLRRWVVGNIERCL